MSYRDQRFCVIIPCYQEGGRIAGVVTAVRRYCDHVVAVDDGSADTTALEARSAGAHVIRHPANRGKGVALLTGFAYAVEQGFEFVITLDGDGQHEPSDIRGFVDAHLDGDAQVLVGNRMGDTAGMPLVRRMTNRYLSWLLSRKMGQRVPDTQSGYRLYSCAALKGVRTEAQRYAAESEILLALADKGVRIGAVPIQVIYRDETSKINPLRDTVRFFAMVRRWERAGERRRKGGWRRE